MISLLIDGIAKGQLLDIDGSYYAIAKSVQVNLNYKEDWLDPNPFTDLGFEKIVYHKRGYFMMPANEQVAIFSVDSKAPDTVPNDAIIQMYMVATYGEHWNSLKLVQNAVVASKTATAKNIFKEDIAFLKYLDEQLKKAYLPAITKQLQDENSWWKSHLNKTNPWLYAGLVSDRSELNYLCRECADMLYWPGANSPLESASIQYHTGKHRAECSYCGPGIFERGIKCQALISIQEEEL